MRKGLRIALIVLGVIIVAAVVGFVAWGETPARPMAEALAALQSDSQVTVTVGEWLTFTPADSQPTTGLVFYPGGRVDYRAYAPAAHQIAAQGYLVVIVRMPLNLAVLDPGAAVKVIAAYPEIQHWAVGGHSLGGAMAANYAKNHPDTVDGLALWAAYPASSDDLSASGLHVVSIFASLDGLATGEKIDASRPLLPADTVWVSIAGGNHAQFGWYGDQAGDNPATISRQEQQDQVIQATVNLLESIR
jgi:pimeloyl-ACP methyl ester carboxylesterase